MEVGQGVETTTSSTPSSSPLPSSWQALVPTPCERTKVLQKCPENHLLLPISWDAILSIYRELVRLINCLPFKKKLIVCLVYRGCKIRVDLGEVKAAGVVCLIGLGLSLGTLLLYRLYFRIIVPFLHSVWASKGENSVLDDEYTLYLEPTDSEVDDRMGNNHSKKSTPSVYYAPGYGVALGSRPPTLGIDSDELMKEEGIRLRPRKLHHSRQKSPSPASDKDSAIGAGGSEMSQSIYSENSANRDSFYSTCTAESGFDDLGFLDDLKGRNLSGSLKENFSPSSLRERNLQMLYRAHHGHDAGLNSLGCSTKPDLDTLSDCSSEKSGIVSSRSYKSSCDGDSSRNVSVKTNIDPFLIKLASEAGSNESSGSGNSQNSREKSNPVVYSYHHASGLESNGAVHDAAVSSPKILSSQSSPCHRNVRMRGGRGRSPFRAINPQQSLSRHLDWSYGDDPNMEYDPSLEASESIRSFNSSIDEIDWDGDQVGEDRMSNLPQFQQSLSDLQFKQSLMQRIHEWSNFAEEYNKSRSPTPDCSPIRFVRRSRSLDRHLGDPSSVLMSDTSDIAATSKTEEMEPTTERNLESLEYELHDIQGEFESITTKLHELIEQGTLDSNPHASPKSSRPHQHPGHSQSGGPHHVQSTPKAADAKQHIGKMRTRWERVPNPGCSESSRSSRASSVCSIEYAWDLADYTNNTTLNVTGERSRSNSFLRGEQIHPAARGLTTDSSLAKGVQASQVINIGLPVSVLDYVEQEWRGETDKARTIREGYSKISQLFSCHRMCVIRGDNFCALRSMLFQILVNGERVTQRWPGIIGIMDNLHDLYNDPTVGFGDWTFANRLPSHCKDRLASLSKCALSLYATIEEVCNLPSREEREKRTIGLLNTSTTFDLELMEGLKVMMMLTLVDLKKQIEDNEEDIPIFAHLLFARDTSGTISEFLKNHLNCVGDSGGLEQVEMCLLGYTLGVRVRVLRLAQCGQTDFDCLFPEDVPTEWPEVDLIAEDDRHYNVPLP